MSKPTLKCNRCKEDFPRDEIIRYTPEGCKTEQKLCKKCYEIKLDNEKFARAIKDIYNSGIDGGKNKQKKLIQEKFGFTTDVIIDTLYYLANVKNIKYPNLGRVDNWPTWVEEMRQYKRAGQTFENLFNNMMHHEYKYEYIDIPDDEEEEIVLDNPNDYLW